MFEYPCEEKRRLLQTWVAEGENRERCETRVVISRESANTYRGQRELISIRDMLVVKQWPIEKVKGIIARGGGVPDPDAPTVPSLTQFWVYTSQTRTDEESLRQRTETQVAAQTTPDGIAAMMDFNFPGRGSGNAAISQEQLDEITRSTAPTSSPGTDY